MTRYSRTRSVWLAAGILVGPTLLGAMVASCGSGSGATGDGGDAALEATPGELDAGDEGDGPIVYLDGGESPLDATVPGDGAGDATLDATLDATTPAGDATLDATTPAGDAGDAAAGSDAADGTTAGSDGGDAALEATAPRSDAGDAALEATTSPTDSGGSTDAMTSEAGQADANPADAFSDSGPPSCSPDCPDGNTCTANADCDSGVCTNGLCTPPLCSPGCPDGNVCRFDTDCASSACNNGTCATSIACGSTCPSGSTCIGEAVPQTNEGQTCKLTCAGSSTIASISDVYATNCKPTDCSSAVDSCVNAPSCNVTLSNSICGGDPCVGVPKGWSFSITCN